MGGMLQRIKLEAERQQRKEQPMNYAGLAELGWRATQAIYKKNGYDDWEKLTPDEQASLKARWLALPKAERERLEKIVCAATDAFAQAVAA